MIDAVAASTLPRLGFVGPNLGRRRGWVTTQSEIVATLFELEGYPVSSTSSVRQPVLRLADMSRFLTRNRRRLDVVILSGFSGRGCFATDAISRLCGGMGLGQVQVLHGGGLSELARDLAAASSWPLVHKLWRGLLERLDPVERA